MANDLPVGLRNPWQWVQPANRSELLQRLADARDLNVHERERENLCSCAHSEIKKLDQMNAYLLATLKRIELGCSFPEDDVQRAIVKIARAAIAKATQS